MFGHTRFRVMYSFVLSNQLRAHSLSHQQLTIPPHLLFSLVIWKLMRQNKEMSTNLYSVSSFQSSSCPVRGGHWPEQLLSHRSSALTLLSHSPLLVTINEEERKHIQYCDNQSGINSNVAKSLPMAQVVYVV